MTLTLPKFNVGDTAYIIKDRLTVRSVTVVRVDISVQTKQTVIYTLMDATRVSEEDLFTKPELLEYLRATVATIQEMIGNYDSI